MTTYETQPGHSTITQEESWERLLRPSSAPTEPAEGNDAAVTGLIVAGAFYVIVSLVLLIGAFWTHGLRDGLIVLLIFGVLHGLTTQCGRIPLAGPILYALIARCFIMPLLFSWFPSIHSSWVTETQFWMCLASAIVLTAMSCMAIAKSRRQ